MAYNAVNIKRQNDYLREHPEYLKELEARQQSRRVGKAVEIAGATPSLNGVEGPYLTSATPVLSESTFPLRVNQKMFLSPDQPRTEKVIQVTSPLYHIEIAAQGGRPISWKLLRYKESLESLSLLENHRRKLETISPRDKDIERHLEFLGRKIAWTREMTERQTVNGPPRQVDDSWPVDWAVEAVPTFFWEGSLPLSLSWGDTSIDDNIPYEPSGTDIYVEDEEKTLVLRGTIGPLEITKTFTFRPDVYFIDYSLSIRNISDHPLAFTEGGDVEGGLHFTWSDGVGIDLFNDPWSPPVLFQVSNKIVSEKTIYNQQRRQGPQVAMNWTLLQSKYFATCIQTNGSVTPKVVAGHSKYDHGKIDLILSIEELNPGEAKEESFSIYVGPKDANSMRSFGHDLERVLFFVDSKIGRFFKAIGRPLAPPILWVLRWIYSFIPNWGVAIIIMTILTKVCMYPLMLKQMRSMKNMQRIAPLQKELQEKFKDNPAKYQKEVMSLYKREKVNPAGGCLPILLTMPIFIAMYQVIYIVPELRGAPFLFWIRDLSQPDSLFTFYMPGFNWVVRFNVLPILNTIYSFWAMKKQVVDPKQAQMMQWMQVFFLFILWNFPSGLVLYWLVQAVLGTVQQSIFNRIHEKETAAKEKKTKKALGPVAARAAQKTKK